MTSPQGKSANLHQTGLLRQLSSLSCLLFLVSATVRAAPLEGNWEIAFDREHAWKRADGSVDHEAMETAWRPVTVPSVWELLEPDYDGVAWYRIGFRAPVLDSGDRARIRFHAVNYLAEVWLNGTPLGSHEGGYTPFEFGVTDSIQSGEANRLLVRVLDPGTHERIDGLFLGGLDRAKKDLEIPQGKERLYSLNFGGIWQPVELLVTGPALLRDVFLVPHLEERSVEFQVQADGPAADCTVEIVLNVLREPDTPLKRRVERLHFRDPQAASYLHTVLMIDQPRPWSPSDPFLYQARVRLYCRGTLSDDHATRFGMREFTYRDGAFLLNGKRILLKGALTQGFYPITLALPEYPELAREEIRLAKEANLNLLRLHLKPHAEEIYHYADEIGLMLYAEPAIGWMADTPELRARCEREVREMILRDRNHPSVVMWGILNEGGRGATGLAMDLACLAQRLDPTRVIIPDSGQGNTIMLPFQQEPVAGFHDRHELLRFPVDDAEFRELAATQGLVSQTGFGGLFDLPRVVADYDMRRLRPDLLDYREYRRQLQVIEEGFRKWRLSEIFGTPRDLLLATQMIEAEAARRQTDARRLSRDMSGIMHCFAGTAWEHCGMLDIWRQRKSSYTAVAQAFEPDRLVAWSSLRNGYLGEAMPLEIHLTAETPVRGRGNLTLQIENASGDLLWEKAGEVEIEEPVQRLLAVHPVINANQEGEYSLLARLEREGKSVAATCYDFHLLRRDRNVPPAVAIGVIPSTAEWETQARALGVNLVAAAPAAATPLVVVFTGDQALEKALPYLADVKQRGKTVLVLLEQPPPRGETPSLLSIPSSEPELAWLRALVREPSVGGPVGYYHYVRPHRILARLPQRRIMGQPYRNICARTSLAGELPTGAEVVVGAFTTTSGEFRWRHTADLVVVPHGSGRIILSTLSITPHLGRDSLADALLLNLLRFAAGA